MLLASPPGHNITAWRKPLLSALVNTLPNRVIIYIRRRANYKYVARSRLLQNSYAWCEFWLIRLIRDLNENAISTGFIATKQVLRMRACHSVFTFSLFRPFLDKWHQRTIRSGLSLFFRFSRFELSLPYRLAWPELFGNFDTSSRTELYHVSIQNVSTLTQFKTAVIAHFQIIVLFIILYQTLSCKI